MKYPKHLLTLIQSLTRLPGVGNKTAERYAFQMLTWEKKGLQEMASIIGEIKDKLCNCPECGCLIDENHCPFCQNARKEAGKICVVATAKDVFAIENIGDYYGFYHVLGGLLSPMEGITPDLLTIEKLLERVQQHHIQEVVVALDSTLEGDATALFLKKVLTPLNVNVSRLAFGLPMGSSLDYIDNNTLARAFSARSSF